MLTVLTGRNRHLPCLALFELCVLLLLLLLSQVTAIFGSSLEVMISVFGETPSAGQVRVAGPAVWRAVR
jgi:hypothetical protein